MNCGCSSWPDNAPLLAEFVSTFIKRIHAPSPTALACPISTASLHPATIHLPSSAWRHSSDRRAAMLEDFPYPAPAFDSEVAVVEDSLSRGSASYAWWVWVASSRLHNFTDSSPASVWEIVTNRHAGFQVLGICIHLSSRISLARAGSIISSTSKVPVCLWAVLRYHFAASYVFLESHAHRASWCLACLGLPSSDWSVGPCSL